MISRELRDQVLRYLDDEIQLQDLESWVVPLIPEYVQNPESDDAEMIAEIELQLAEYAENLRDEAQIKEALRDFLMKQPIIYIYDPSGLRSYFTSTGNSCNYSFKHEEKPSLEMELLNYSITSTV